MLARLLAMLVWELNCEATPDCSFSTDFNICLANFSSNNDHLDCMTGPNLARIAGTSGCRCHANLNPGLTRRGSLLVCYPHVIFLTDFFA
jgi:hypothetical protein